MAASNVSELYRACRDGDVESVRRLLPRSSISELNRLESNGSSCLHAACSNGRADVVPILLDHGAFRQLKDKDGHTPLQVTNNQEIIDRLARSTEEAVEHYAVDQTQRLKWLFGQDQAEAYSRAIHWGCIKDRGVKETVKKIEHAGILQDNDESKDGKLLRFYLNEAREKNDPTFFLKMYTINGLFFDALNKYMATGRSQQVFDKLCHKWSGYYTGAVMKNPALDPYRFAGITYRGMIINQQEFEQYQRAVVLTNKAFQSTSKSPTVALRFATSRLLKAGEVSVIIQYNIVDRKSALDIALISEFPDEKEVLMVPGGLFRVDDVNNNRNPCEIFLRQLPWTHE